MEIFQRATAINIILKGDHKHIYNIYIDGTFKQNQNKGNIYKL